MERGVGFFGLLLLACHVQAFRISHDRIIPYASNACQIGKFGEKLAAMCTALVVLGTDPSQATMNINDAIIESSHASYPILKALDATKLAPISEKIGGILLDIDPEKLARSIDLGLNLYNSVPPEKVTSFNAVVEEAFGALKTDACDLVPLPPIYLVDKLQSSKAVSLADPNKFKAFDEKWGRTLKLLPKTESSICLPSVDSLEKLALAQADVGRSLVSSPEAPRFAKYTVSMLKSSVPPAKVVPLIKLADQLQYGGSTYPERARFGKAATSLEKASKAEFARQK